MKRLKLKLLVTAAAAVALTAAFAAATAQAARGLNLGLVDPQALQAPDAATRSVWLNRAQAARANTVIVGVRWAGTVSDNPPPEFDATDPADPAYNWARTDAAVREATARGLRVLIHVSGAPAFAEAPNRPSTALKETWLPDPDDIADFGTAIARRYSGSFRGLPRVVYYQLWAEPNLGVNLMPQTVGGALVSGNHYRKMENAWYDAVKAVRRDNVVVTAGSAPYGLTPAEGAYNPRTMPILFWRQFFCLEGDALRPVSCPDPPKLDVIAAHPINAAQPRKTARYRLDVGTPDLWKIKRILDRANATGRVRPAGTKPFWATELLWNSNPPDPRRGVKLRTHARWLAEAFYLMWKQRVDTAVWFEIRDYQDTPGYAIPRCGLFFRNGRAKPAFWAYRFPFVGERLKSRKRSKRGKRLPNPRVRVWGMAAGPGKVLIQKKVRRGKKRKAKRGRKWKTIKKLRAGGNRVFIGRVRLKGAGLLRAKQGKQKSLPWRQKATAP